MSPNPTQPRAGVTSTPSTPFGGTQANDAFNAMVRSAALGPVCADEVVKDALDERWLLGPGNGEVATLVVEALREAGLLK